MTAQEVTRLSGLLADAQKIIAEYKASTIAGARGGGLAQASTIPDCYRDEMLRGLIAFFSESVHAVWDSGEIADCLTDMMSEASSVSSAQSNSGGGDAGTR